MIKIWGWVLRYQNHWWVLQYQNPWVGAEILKDFAHHSQV